MNRIGLLSLVNALKPLEGRRVVRRWNQSGRDREFLTHWAGPDARMQSKGLSPPWVRSFSGWLPERLSGCFDRFRPRAPGRCSGHTSGIFFWQSSQYNFESKFPCRGSGRSQPGIWDGSSRGFPPSNQRFLFDRRPATRPLVFHRHYFCRPIHRWCHVISLVILLCTTVSMAATSWSIVTLSMLRTMYYLVDVWYGGVKGLMIKANRLDFVIVDILTLFYLFFNHFVGGPTLISMETSLPGRVD